MEMASAELQEEILSKFTDLFHQFKAFSSHYHKQQVIWYVRLFVKCCTICILSLLGFFYYRNGVFEYNEYAGLYSAILMICIFHSTRQLMTDRKLKSSFKEVNDEFENMSEALSRWCHVNNPSFVKILKLLLEETKNDKNFNLKSNDLVSLIVFDAVIWFVDLASLLINIFHERQLYFTVLLFFIVILVTIAIENILINMKNESKKTNENMIVEINKVCFVVNKFKENLDDTFNSYGKMEPETTTSTNEDSGFMEQASKEDDSCGGNTSAASIMPELEESTTKGKQRVDTHLDSDGSIDEVHLAVKKCKSPQVSRRKDANQKNVKVFRENQLETTSKTSHDTEQFNKKEIKLQFGKFAFRMDLHPESEIELEFKSRGKAKKKSFLVEHK